MNTVELYRDDHPGWKRNGMVLSFVNGVTVSIAQGIGERLRDHRNYNTEHSVEVAVWSQEFQGAYITRGFHHAVHDDVIGWCDANEVALIIAWAHALERADIIAIIEAERQRREAL